MKKLVSIGVVLILILSLCGCKSNDNLDKYKNPDKIAVKLNSPEYKGALEYSKENGIELVNYNSHSDAVVAFESQKCKGIIINEIDSRLLDKKYLENCKKENINHPYQYCAYFDKSNNKLYNEFKKEFDSMNSDGTTDKIISDYINNVETKLPFNNKNGKIKVICCPVFENRFYRDEKGNISGADYIILSYACSRLGYEIEFVESDFEDMFQKLQDGEGDIIFSATQKTKERIADYLYADYFTLETFIYKN